MSSTAQQAKTFQFKKWKKGFDTQPSLATAVGAQANHTVFNSSSFPVMKKNYHATGWQQSGAERPKTPLPSTGLSTHTTPVATILTLASKQSSGSSTTNSSLPQPQSATASPHTFCFLQQPDETLNKINRKNRPSAKRKSMVLVMMGLLLSGGLVAGAMNISVSEHPLTGTNKKVPKVKTSNKKPLPELTAQAEPLADMFDEPTYQTKATQVAYVPPVSTTQLADPPSSAVDDTLSFETNASTVQQEKSVKTGNKPTHTAHLVDLFEDAAPVPSLSLPEQKKRESLEEALASPPVIPVYQQPSNTGNTNKHWWEPNFKSIFNFRRPLMHLTVSSHFGHRWGRMHRGVDFSAPYGVAIYAANAGTVVYSGWEQGYGKLVIIDHGNGVRTKYAHCSKLNVSVGDWIEKGERIARVGSTGHSTGPHLHFEVVVNGQTRNPLNYLTT